MYLLKIIFFLPFYNKRTKVMDKGKKEKKKGLQKIRRAKFKYLRRIRNNENNIYIYIYILVAKVTSSFDERDCLCHSNILSSFFLALCFIRLPLTLIHSTATSSFHPLLYSVRSFVHWFDVRAPSRQRRTHC